jgi:hypothetical protein
MLLKMFPGGGGRFICMKDDKLDKEVPYLVLCWKYPIAGSDEPS